MKEINEMTYDELVSAQIRIQDRLLRYEKLEQCGIPKRLLRLYKDIPFACCKSGYSMGEKVELWCGKVQLDVLDYRKSYSGKYRGSEKHGKLVYRFTKKALRQCFDLLEKSSIVEDMLKLKNLDDGTRADYLRQFTELHNDRLSLFEQAYCRDESIVKKAPNFAGYQLTRPRTEKLSTN